MRTDAEGLRNVPTGSGDEATSGNWAAVAEALRSRRGPGAAAVHVAGRPGGLIRVRGGQVAGVWTTGSPLAIPSPSRRGAPPAPGGPLSRAAVADALFVIAAGRVEGVRVEGDRQEMPIEGGLEVDRALAEVERRLGAFGAPEGPHPEEDRPVALSRDGHAALTPGERAVRGLSDGGLTVRDIAFLLDRGVFGVLLDVVALQERGHVRLDRGTVPASDPPSPAASSSPAVSPSPVVVPEPVRTTYSSVRDRRAASLTPSYPLPPGTRPAPVPARWAARTSAAAGAAPGTPGSGVPVRGPALAGIPVRTRPLAARPPTSTGDVERTMVVPVRVPASEAESREGVSAAPASSESVSAEVVPSEVVSSGPTAPGTGAPRENRVVSLFTRRRGRPGPPPDPGPRPALPRRILGEGAGR
ncbi:hypothetical protein GCM10009836_10980 [Pseudonocardia ailaonensis]|uniref:Roadblock/LAMTOR2 domain-containing protein n=1 Tax=Pseudonocardia ailaonensis TaxID=367279 RepID=A0ABN2MR48_9PSEU